MQRCVGRRISSRCSAVWAEGSVVDAAHFVEWDVVCVGSMVAAVVPEVVVNEDGVDVAGLVLGGWVGLQQLHRLVSRQLP